MFCFAEFRAMAPLSFEKDDDENGHIDFITAGQVQILFSIAMPHKKTPDVSGRELLK